ncbi:thiolase family protein [Caryophanon latum]|uniref:acetyl-CoA C-acetyltransferase n=1 Tax=Caryophanon latum TaxID=33977 RepID=A0A1C0YPX0_9BACL|nr:thiolase family protein [Caryophanon latum]OCS89203.1 beta-ketoadipyl CoA thiolase [Caryophanon latum]
MVYIVEGARTAFGTYGGMFKDVSDMDLAVTAVKGALERSNVDAKDVEEIIIGNIIQTSASSPYLARHIGLHSGLTNESRAFTLNRLCGSGMQSIISGAQSILLGDADIIVAGGTENMTQAPRLLQDTRFGTPNKVPRVDDMLWGTLTDNYIGCGMGITAENLAEKYNISREEQDAYAFESHKKATAAAQSGRLAKEIVPVVVQTRKGEVVLDKDEHIRPEFNLEKIATLRPSFKKDGTVTAANASGINDGAAAVVIMSEKEVQARNIKPLAKIVAYAVEGVDPSIMGIGPAPATLSVLKKAGLTLEDIDVFEFNEAFSAQSIAVLKELGVQAEKVNVNGGAVALGHPVGASGARVTYTLAKELQERQVKYGIASLCIGGGQGIAILLERV